MKKNIVFSIVMDNSGRMTIPPRKLSEAEKTAVLDKLAIGLVGAEEEKV